MNDIHVNISDGKIPRFLSLLETGTVVALVDARPPTERNVKDAISRHGTYPKSIKTAGLGLVLSAPSDDNMLVVAIDDLEAGYMDAAREGRINHECDNAYKVHSTASGFSVLCMGKNGKLGFDMCSGNDLSIDLVSGLNEACSTPVRDVAIRIKRLNIKPSNDGQRAYIHHPDGDTFESQCNTID